ncbi:uncharacterized protein LOC116176030 [Photinus pyralis]|uniref:uncharacterized protein LOC116176030 n=1 Tax=Photinus pyralis TaxID=7054 RepID=UPI00126725A2|nr:uncharacterized protein LOC116176030 [Photinus pyralis]
MPSTTEVPVYSSSQLTPIENRASSITITKHENPEYAINRLSQKYDSYHGLLYRNDRNRRRLSSTGEGSGDSSTTASGSSCGEREDGSEGRAESDEMDRDDRDERVPLEGKITDIERQQVETFFKGLKTEVNFTVIQILYTDGFLIVLRKAKLTNKFRSYT